MSAALKRTGLGLIIRPRAVEAALWRRLRLEADGASRTRLFDHYLALARSIARREFARRPAYGLERGDFEQFAFAGLLEAIDRFDPLHGAPFEAYARARIRGAIADGLSASSEAGAQYAHHRRIERERMRSLTAGTKDKDAIEALGEIAAGLALGLIAEDATRLIEALPSPELDAYETRAWRELELGLIKALDELTEPMRTILKQHYLHGVEFAQIANLLGLSRGRVSQLHRSALMVVRDRLRYKD